MVTSMPRDTAAAATSAPMKPAPMTAILLPGTSSGARLCASERVRRENTLLSPARVGS